MKHDSRHVSIIRVGIVLTLLLAIGAVVGYSARDRIERIAVAPAPAGTVAPAVAAITPEERVFYIYVGNNMQELEAEAAKLAALGDSKSRNVVELQVRANRIDAISGEIDSYLATHPTPLRFQNSMDAYRAAVAQMRAGINGTKSAFVKFDWNGVTAGLRVFKAGSSRLNDASAALVSEAGGTPEPTSS
jgi:hypothetical protein